MDPRGHVALPVGSAPARHLGAAGFGLLYGGRVALGLAGERLEEGAGVGKYAAVGHAVVEDERERQVDGQEAPSALGLRRPKAREADLAEGGAPLLTLFLPLLLE